LKHPSTVGWFGSSGTSSNASNANNDNSISDPTSDLKSPDRGAATGTISKSSHGEGSGKPVKPKRLRCALVYPSAFGGWVKGANSSPLSTRVSPSSSPVLAPTSPTETSTAAAMSKQRKKVMSPSERNESGNGGASVRNHRGNAASPVVSLSLNQASPLRDQETSLARAKQLSSAENDSDDSRSDNDGDNDAGALALAVALGENQNEPNSGSEKKECIMKAKDAEDDHDDDDDQRGVFIAARSSLQDGEDAADRRDREAGQTGGGSGGGSGGSMSRVGVGVWNSLGRAAGAVQVGWHSSLGRAMTFGSNRRLSGGHSSAPQAAAAAVWALSWDVDSAFKGSLTRQLMCALRNNIKIFFLFKKICSRISALFNMFSSHMFVASTSDNSCTTCGLQGAP